MSDFVNPKRINIWQRLINVAFSLGCLLMLAGCSEHSSTVKKDIVFSQNPINHDVGKIMSDSARNASKVYFCRSGDFSIAIIDAGNSSVPNLSIQKVAEDYNITLPWLFESNEKRDSNADYSSGSQLKYYTRSNSRNYYIIHELGHMIFTRYVMNNKYKFGEYASVAPDWLDESAAIVFEKTSVAERRRNEFYRHFITENIYALPSYLSIKRSSSKREGSSSVSVSLEGKHIVANTSTNLGNTELGVPNATVSPPIIFWNENRKEKITLYDGYENNLYYAQSRVFIDYLLVQSNNLCLLADIGHFIAKGNTFEDWLKVQKQIAEVHNIAELENQFMEWIRKEAARRNVVTESVDNGR